MIGKYDVNVELIRITSEGEQLIEFASRLCVDKTEGTGSRVRYIQDRMEQGHLSVLEHASASFHIRCSRAATHELVRHRIAAYSQRSQRYVKETKPRYITPPELTDKVIEPGVLEGFIRNSGFSGFFLPFRRYMAVATTTLATVSVLAVYESFIKLAWVVYGLLLKSGVKPEIARYVLPNACETQIVSTWNFRECLHIIPLRTCKLALPEMRYIIGLVYMILADQAPQVFNFTTCICEYHGMDCLREVVDSLKAHGRW